MPAEPLLDRAFLEKLERLTLRWNKSFPGLVGGHNISRFAGAGQEFLDHRNFHHGDDLRAVNWRAYLRLEKLFLKMFQVEPRIPVRMLVDASDSMTAGGAGKFDYARRLAAALCYIALVRLDSLEIHSFASRLGQRNFCTGGRHRFSQAMNTIAAMKADGGTDFLGVVREFCSTYTQRGLLIVVSDFLDDQGCDRALQYLADFGHELLLVQLWNEEDRTPPWLGELELTDAESGARLALDFDLAAQERYTRSFDEYCDTIQQVAVRASGRYVGVSTATPIDEVVFGPLLRSRGAA